MKWMTRFRLLIQAAWAALTNGYINGFLQGKIYTGPLKKICVPGLNCYSCPGALGACPIGALQAVISDWRHSFSFYVVGFLLAVGAVCGRFVCGFLCPFGLVQDLLHKIPVPGKRQRIPGDGLLRYLKYGVLLVFVLILPMTVVNIVGQGSPWFCKWICPSGTLMAGIPLVGGDGALRGIVGWLFGWKMFLLMAILLLSLWIYRPFCKYLCPLGAIYGLLNPVSLLRLKLDGARCTRCGRCAEACDMGLDPVKKRNSPECIRCGACVRACPTQALAWERLFSREKGGCKGACTGACSGCGRKGTERTEG